MSKNSTLGMIVKAAISIPDAHGEVAAKLLSRLAHDHPQGTELHQQFRELLEGRAQIVPIPVPFFKRQDLVRLPARIIPIDLDQFFRTRPGLYVFDSFRERFELGVVSSAPERLYVGSLLNSCASNQDIRRELSESHLSALEDIAGFIEAQANGEKGFLLTNYGYVNIFYVLSKNGEVFALRVSWDSHLRRWDVFSFTLDESNWWRAQNQVLIPGNPAL